MIGDEEKIAELTMELADILKLLAHLESEISRIEAELTIIKKRYLH